MRKAAAIVIPLTVGAMALAACGSSKKSPNTPSPNKPGKANGAAPFSPAATAKGGTVVATIEKDVADFNIATSTGNTFDGAQAMQGIYPGVYNVGPDLKPFLDTNLMTSAKLTSSSPETVEYKISPKAVWSDGVPIDASDFTYTWNAQSGKDKDYDVATTTGYEDIASITGSDAGKTVTVVYKTPFADWQSLFAPLFPAHYMSTLAGKTDADKFNKGLLPPNFPKISGGPLLIKSFTPNDVVKEVPNPKYFGPATPLTEVDFKIITDATQEPTALQNGEVSYIYPQPQIDIVNQVKGFGDQFKTNIGYGLVFEHFDFNLKNKALSDVALRKALFTAVDRKALIASTVGQFDPATKLAPLGSRMLLPSQDGYKDSTTAYNGDLDAAKKILTDAKYTGVGTKLVAPDGTPVPDLRMRYTVGNAVRQSECELFQKEAASLGVKVDIVTTDDLGNTLDSHDFDVIVFAWVGTPYPYSANKALYVTGGGSNYDSYSNKTVDDSLTAAAGELDPSKAQTDLNTADQQLSDDAVTLPLYQKATFLAVSTKFVNIVNNSSNVGPAWNVGEWGTKAS